jgi:tetratricopeptide (TPR) repeat protein
MLNDQYTQAIVFRGETYRQMERFEEALTDLNKAINLDDQHAWAIAFRGETYRQTERFEEALADFDKAIALDDQYAWAIACRGETYRQMERFEEALADFDKAIALDKEEEWYWYGRALTHLLMFNIYRFFLDINSSLDISLSNLQKNPGDYRIAFNTAIIQLVSGQFYNAEVRYANLIASGPSIHRLRAAISDLADFLKIQPEYELARKIHGQLQKRIDELK